MIDCNEWKTEKHHECTNTGKVKLRKLWWQLYITSLPERDVQNFRLLDFCWTECTQEHLFVFSGSKKKLKGNCSHTSSWTVHRDKMHWWNVHYKGER